MKFYAYLPNEDGKEPIGTENRILFELKTLKGAEMKCCKRFKTHKFKLFSYTNAYDIKTFREYI